MRAQVLEKRIFGSTQVERKGQRLELLEEENYNVLREVVLDLSNQEGEVLTGFWWGNLREGDHLKDPGVDGRIMDLWEVVCGVIDWFDLAQDRDRWRTVVNAVMNLRVP
jgi:hypothetical protein